MKFLFFGLWGLFSLITFLLYAVDKRRARKGKWRLSERLLLSLSFLLGAPGALLGMVLCRHKTRHWYFWAVTLLGLLGQACLLFWAC